MRRGEVVQYVTAQVAARRAGRRRSGVYVCKAGHGFCSYLVGCFFEISVFFSACTRAL
jgi:hypothetical protein